MAITIIGIILYSCQDDDVCLDASTPYLSFEFVNSNNDSLVLDSLYIDIKKSDGTFSNILKSGNIYKGKIPLGDETQGQSTFYFYYTHNAPDSEKDIINVTYSTTSEYISKACGFKLNYHNLNFNLQQPYSIQSLTPLTTDITDESKTNLHIVY